MTACCALAFHASAVAQSTSNSREDDNAADASARQGTRLGWELHSGIGYTDNLYIDPSPKQEETIVSAGLALQGQHVGRRLKAQIDSDVAYFDYLEDLAEAEVIGEARGEVIFGFAPDRFEWNIGDEFTQSRPSQFEAVTPANREYVNHFFTGPRLAVRLAEGLDLTGSGEFRNTRYETSPYDGNRYFGAAGLRRRLSRYRALFALASSEKFEFDNLTSGEDFKRNEYFIRLHSAAARGGFVIDAGYTSLGGVGGVAGDNKNGGTLFRLSANRAISRHGSVALSVGKEFSTSSDLFAPRGDVLLVGDLAGEQAFSAATPFEQRFVSASWQLSLPRTALRVAGRFSKEEFAGAGVLAPNRDTVFWIAAADRRVSPMTDLAVEISGGRDDYSSATLDSSELRAATRATRSLSRTLRLSVELAYLDRSDVAGDARELRGLLTLSYGRGMEIRPLRRIGVPDSGGMNDLDIR